MNTAHPKTALKLVALWLLAGIPGAQAADWTVKQTTTLSGAVISLTQGGTTDSQQALNAIILDSANDSLTASSQQATFGNQDFSLTQTYQPGESPNSNVQAINLASAKSIDGLTQSASGFRKATLSQRMLVGANNVQAINYAVATDVINNTTQTVTGGTIELNKPAAVDPSNVQAVNYLRADRYTGTIRQRVDLTDALMQTGYTAGQSGTIRVNSLQGDTSAAQVTQDVTVRNIVVRASGDISDPSSTVIINYIAP